MNGTDIKLILVDPRENLCEQFRGHFAEFSSVSVVCGVFESLPEFDCMVSAANSFGLMDGGVDLAITNFFGRDLMKRVQDHIIEHFRGEQPVGISFIISTGSDKHPFVAHTPTMRIPMRVASTDNVYKAMWAMLLAVDQHNRVSGRKIGTIACPGLGTATGGVSPHSAARQMSLAYRHFLSPPTWIDWTYAEERQRAIGLGGDDDPTDREAAVGPAE